MTWKQLVPPFLILFLLAALLKTMGAIPEEFDGSIKAVAVLFTAIALSAVGLSTPIKAMKEAGWRPLALGGLLWALVATSALGLQLVTGQI